MSMFNHYHINGATRIGTDPFGTCYTHLFATAPDLTRGRADMVLELMRAKFTESAGYKVTMTYWQAPGGVVEA